MDKKDYYTSAENYVDDDDLTRSFTFIDHTRKAHISSFIPTGEATEQHRKDREKLIADILCISASFCPLPFSDFTIRGEALESIEWNEKMLKDEGLPFDKLTTLKTIISNRMKINNKTY